ncbi:MAG: hypothetical protein SFY95_00290, partial [Planctomycetota bacterium]|nr:hypothetical protein [Planctomycetota bacterium]
AGAGRAANMIRMSMRYTAPPEKPGQPVRPAAKWLFEVDPGYRGSLPSIPPFNNSHTYVDVGRNGVRVDADWRPAGSTGWQYYGGQTSGRQGENNIARFNPFYLPSGAVEIRFRASGFSDRVVRIDIPR